LFNTRRITMKHLIIIFAMIIVANITGFGPTVCNAELDGAAPLPEIKKSTGPSLEETTKWITEKMASLPSIRKKSIDRYAVSFDGCEMALAYHQGRDVMGASVEIKYLQLKNLDDAKIEIRSYENTNIVRFGVLGDVKGVTRYEVRGVSVSIPFSDKQIKDIFPIKDEAFQQDNPYGGLQAYNEENHSIAFLIMTINGQRVRVAKYPSSTFASVFIDDVGVAESMKNAFKHAVMLCQQKEAGEKAAQPPKKKELF